MLSLLLSLPFLVPAVASPSPSSAPAEHLAVVDLGRHAARELLERGLDVVRVDAENGIVQILADDAELEWLERAGYGTSVLIEDLQGHYAERLAAPYSPLGLGSYGAWLSPPFSQGSMGGYYTYAEIASVLDQLTAAYPAIVSPRQSLGQSLEGRDQWMVKISDSPGVDEDEPEVRLDALHHSREPEGMQVTLWFALFLVEEYGQDPLATYLVDEREIFFVPCVNPDGYEYNRQIAPGGGGLWRKNRRDNGGGSIGVDLNRNYPFQWGFDDAGSSPAPSSVVYRGPSAMSEPEVQNMVAFISGREFGTALSVHTYSDLWLAPWGYDELYPANWPQYDEVGTLVTEANGLPHGPASIILYEANGVTGDYDHSLGTLAWAPEIGSDADGFWPPQARIVPLAQEHLLALQRTALAAGPWVRLADVELVDLGDGDGFLERGEPFEVVADLRNSGRGASGAIDLELSSASGQVSVTTAQASAPALAAFSSGQNATPLVGQVSPGAGVGVTVQLVLTVTYDGYAQDFPIDVTLGEEVTLASFDFEGAGNQGWSVGSPNDATTGTWTRLDPRGTNAQPEDDHSSPGTVCWVTGQGSIGGGDGENDVDNGSTTLVSPVFDLAGRTAPRVRYWRWYSNNVGASPNEDVLVVDLSNDGGSSWVNAETVGPSGAESSGGWFEANLMVESILPLTSQMRLRVIASDLGDGSIVEAAFDDFDVVYFEGELGTLLCSPAVANSTGEPGRMHVSGSATVTDDDLVLTATQLPAGSNIGYFMMGQGTNVFTPPGSAGPICISPGLLRIRPPVSNTNELPGGFTRIVGTSGPQTGNITPGSAWSFQAWHRDIAAGTSNLTDAVRVTFQ